MPQSKPRRKKSRKRVLALPDLEQAKAAVLNSLTSGSGQRTYDHAIGEFVGCSGRSLARRAVYSVSPDYAALRNEVRVAEIATGPPIEFRIAVPYGPFAPNVTFGRARWMPAADRRLLHDAHFCRIVRHLAGRNASGDRRPDANRAASCWLKQSRA